MEPTLRRTLRLRDLVLLVIGSVIGSGIFLVPGMVLQQTGGYLGPMLLVWATAGLLSLLGALTYGELAAMHPRAGGLYVYVRDAFGPLPAFLLGWTLFFVIATGAVATLAVAFATYLERLVPVPAGLRWVVPLATIAVLAAVNVRGARTSAAVQNVSTLLKTGAILVMAVLLLALGTGLRGGVQWWPAEASGGLLSGLGLSVVAVLWAYEGWQYVTFAAGEVVEPERTFPRGITLGTLSVVAVYLLANLAYAAALGPAGMAASRGIAADATGAVLGPVAEKLVAAASLVAIFSCAHALTFTSPRVYFAMAGDGVFFRKLAEVHPRFGTPAFAIVAGSAWSMLLAATGTFETLLTYVVFAGWIFYALGAASIFVFRARMPDAPRPYRVPGYPLTPLLFCLASAAIVVNTLVTQPKQAMVGLGVVLLGTPVFYLWRARSRAAGVVTGD